MNRKLVFACMVLSILVVMLWIGCGGGSGGGSKTAQQVASYPVGGSVTGLAGTLILQLNGGSDEVILVDGAFSFPKALKEGSKYTVTVSSRPIMQNVNIINGTGVVSEKSSTLVKVVCSDKDWYYPTSLDQNISPDGQNVFQSRVVTDNMGNAMVVWIQNNGSSREVYKSEYRNGTWLNPQDLQDSVSPLLQDTSNLAVAMSGNGDALIVWQEFDTSNEQIYKSEYRDGTWTHPANQSDDISPNGEDAGFPQVAMDGDGNAIIAWQQADNTGTLRIFKSEYRNGVWVHPASLVDSISQPGQDAQYPQVAMGDDGYAVILWQQSNGSHEQVFKSEYQAGNWTHPNDLADNISPDGKNAVAPRVAVNDLGHALIVWQQSDGFETQIFMSQGVGGSWVHPTSLTDNISPDGQPTAFPEVALDNVGNALIVWNQHDGLSTQVFISEFRENSWTHPSNVLDNISPLAESAWLPQPAMDDNGNALVTWFQEDGNKLQVFKSEYRNSAWIHPAGLIDNITLPDEDARQPYPAMSNSGNAFICWRQNDGNVEQIFVSEFL